MYSEIVPAIDHRRGDPARARPRASSSAAVPSRSTRRRHPPSIPGVYELGHPDPRPLLRRPAHGAAAGRHGRAPGQGEYGRTELSLTAPSPLCPDWPATSTVWMSHGDAITAVPEGFTAPRTRPGRRSRPCTTPSDGCSACSSTPRWCTPSGASELLDHFLIDVCGCLPGWTHVSIIEEQVARGPRPGGRRPRAVRAVGRRRLGRGRGPRAQGRRRPAHLRLRRHRPHARGRGRPGRGHLPSPVRRRPRAREGGRTASSPRSRGSPTPSASARSSASCSSGSSRRWRATSPAGAGDGDHRAPLPRAGHAVPRRHRVGSDARRQHQEPPQRRRSARRPRLRPRRAAPPAVQGRGPRRRRGARPARTRSCGASRSRARVSRVRIVGEVTPRARRDPAQRRRRRRRRDPPGRPVPRAVAELRRVAGRAHRGGRWATAAPTRTRS